MAVWGTASGDNTANTVARELFLKLDRSEKNKVVGLLSKTIFGAEVVDFRVLHQFVPVFLFWPAFVTKPYCLIVVFFSQ